MRTADVDRWKIEVVQNAIVRTATGVAGYFEVRLPAGSIDPGGVVRVSGMWDNPYGDGDEMRHMQENVVVRGQAVFSEDENSFMVPLEIGPDGTFEDGDGVLAEMIADALADMADAENTKAPPLTPAERKQAAKDMAFDAAGGIEG